MEKSTRYTIKESSLLLPQASDKRNEPTFKTYSFNVHCLSFVQLKVDKLKLIELCGASETEFSSVRDAFPIMPVCCSS